MQTVLEKVLVSLFVLKTKRMKFFDRIKSFSKWVLSLRQHETSTATPILKHVILENFVI